MKRCEKSNRFIRSRAAGIKSTVYIFPPCARPIAPDRLNTLSRSCVLHKHKTSLCPLPGQKEVHDQYNIEWTFITSSEIHFVSGCPKRALYRKIARRLGGLSFLPESAFLSPHEASDVFVVTKPDQNGHNHKIKKIFRRKNPLPGQKG